MVKGCRNKHSDSCAGHWQFKTTHLVYKAFTHQNLRPRLYIPIEGVWSPAGGYKVSEDFQAFEARCQDSRHFEAVDSELTSWETSKHVS